MDFKVVGLNKSLHDILMIQVFGDCKTRLEISEDIYFCFFGGQAEGQEIDPSSSFLGRGFVFQHPTTLRCFCTSYKGETPDFFFQVKLLPFFHNFIEIWNILVFQEVRCLFCSFFFLSLSSNRKESKLLMYFILDRFCYYHF